MTGWRYVAEELAAAGVTAHLAELADTAFAAAASGTPRPIRPTAGIRDAGRGRRLQALGPPPATPERRALPSWITTCGPSTPPGTADRRRRRPARAPRPARATPNRAARDRAAGRRRSTACPGRAPGGRDRPGDDRRPGRAGRTWSGTSRRTSPGTWSAPRSWAPGLRGGAGHRVVMTCWLAGPGRFSSSRQVGRSAGAGRHRRLLDRKGPPGRCPARTAGAARAGHEGGRPRPGPRERTTPTTPRSRTGAAERAALSEAARSSGRPATLAQLATMCWPPPRPLAPAPVTSP